MADHQAEHGHEAEHHHEAGIIELSEAQAEAAGLETEIVTPATFSSVIRTSGEILPAQGDESTVVATVSGVVSFDGIKVLPGSKVGKGATIAHISSKSMADGDLVAKTKAAYEATEKEYERAKALLEDKAISEKAFEQAKLAYDQAKAEYGAYDGKTVEQGLRIESPLAGQISQVFVKNGEYVNAGSPIATVSENRRLVLQADLPEKFWSSRNLIADANFKPSHASEVSNVRTLGGRIVSVGNASTQGSFYIPVTFEFNNVGNFIPGSYCEIYLIEGQRENVISVPETALTEEQGVYFVYLKVGEDDYKKQEVGIGAGDGLRREILKGLSQGDEVVTKGAYQVKLASVSGAVPEGHHHNH